MTVGTAHQPGLVLIGAGGHAAVVAEAAILAGMALAGVLDDNPEAALGLAAPGVRRLGAIADIPRHAAAPMIVAVGDVALRAWLIDALRRAGAAAAPPIVHPRAFVSPSATLGRGVFVGPGAVIHSRAVIENHAIINSAAVIEHDCRIGANTHVAPGAAIGGGVVVGAGTLVGLGAHILPHVTVGVGAVIGAGAAVVRDVDDGQTVAGVPAAGIPR